MARPKRVGEPQRAGLEYRFEKVVRSKQCYELDTRLVALIKEFPHYVKSVRDVQPTPDEVVEQALFDVFNSHAEFRAWQEQTRGRGRAEVENKAAKESANVVQKGAHDASQEAA